MGRYHGNARRRAAACNVRTLALAAAAFIGAALFWRTAAQMVAQTALRESQKAGHGFEDWKAVDTPFVGTITADQFSVGVVAPDR